MKNMFYNIVYCIKQKKALYITFIILAIVMLIIGVITAINFGSSSPLNLSNIPYIRFLRGNSGLFSLIFNLIISSLIVYLIILLCCSVKFLIPLAIIFYLYFIYSLGVIFTSILLIFGVFSTLILLILLLVFFTIEIILYTAILCELLCQTKNCYFKNCFNPKQGCNLYLSLILLVTILCFCIILSCLKSYIILLVY